MTLQSPTATLIPLFSSSELTGRGYPGLLDRKNRSDMCPRWESNPRLTACKARLFAHINKQRTVHSINHDVESRDGYVPLRFGGNVVMRMVTQQQHVIFYTYIRTERVRVFIINTQYMFIYRRYLIAFYSKPFSKRCSHARCIFLHKLEQRQNCSRLCRKLQHKNTKHFNICLLVTKTRYMHFTA